MLVVRVAALVVIVTDVWVALAFTPLELRYPYSDNPIWSILTYDIVLVGAALLFGGLALLRPSIVSVGAMSGVAVILLFAALIAQYNPITSWTQLSFVAAALGSFVAARQLASRLRIVFTVVDGALAILALVFAAGNVTRIVALFG